MSSATLHPEKGFNPRLCSCPRCGRVNGELAFLGTNDRKVTCPQCGRVNYCVCPQDECAYCEEQLQGGEVKTIEESEHIPTVLCKECREEMTLHQKIVAEGGVYFKCSECHNTGVIRPSAFAQRVRRAQGEDCTTPHTNGRYKPCGVEFEKCSEHA